MEHCSPPPLQCRPTFLFFMKKNIGNPKYLSRRSGKVDFSSICQLIVLMGDGEAKKGGDTVPESTGINFVYPLVLEDLRGTSSPAVGRSVTVTIVTIAAIIEQVNHGVRAGPVVLSHISPGIGTICTFLVYWLPCLLCSSLLRM